jgi:hypothetical protein
MCQLYTLNTLLVRAIREESVEDWAKSPFYEGFDLYVQVLYLNLTAYKAPMNCYSDAKDPTTRTFLYLRYHIILYTKHKCTDVKMSPFLMIFNIVASDSCIWANNFLPAGPREGCRVGIEHGAAQRTNQLGRTLLIYATCKSNLFFIAKITGQTIIIHNGTITKLKRLTFSLKYVGRGGGAHSVRFLQINCENQMLKVRKFIHYKNN